MTKDNSGPAFPSEQIAHYESRAYPHIGSVEVPVYKTTGGLTKREWFAGMTLQGILAGDGSGLNKIGASFEYTEDGVAKVCHQMADAMLKAGEE